MAELPLHPVYQLLPGEIWTVIAQADDDDRHDKGYVASLLSSTCHTLHRLLARPAPPIRPVFLRWLGRHVTTLAFSPGPRVRYNNHERPVDPDPLIYGAIERGRLKTLVALAEASVSFRPSRFLCHAVKEEQKAVIQWLVKDQKVPRYAEGITTAAAHNSIDFLNWLYRDAGFKNMSNQAMANAASRGSDEHLRWLYERGCPSDHLQMFALATSGCSIPTLTWLLEKAVIKPQPALPTDAMANSLAVIQVW